MVAKNEETNEKELETVRPKSGPSVPKIYQAIAKIQEGVERIPKNGKGPSAQGSYPYAKNDDILRAVVKLMNENGVITQVNMSEYQAVERRIGADRFVAMAVVRYQVDYISIVDGSSFRVVVYPEGGDNSDKATRKAATQGQKMANILTFNIDTGEPDPDGDDPAVSSAKAPAANAKIQAAGGGQTFNQIKAFLGEAQLTGAVANAIGTRISGGKEPAVWKEDESVLVKVLGELKAGVVE